MYLKFLIQQSYRKDIHFVWCSENFDSSKLGTYQPGANIPPSSDPAGIYRNLLEAVQKSDRHNQKIAQQKTSLKALAIEWERNREITAQDKHDIIYMVDNGSFKDWRPLIFVIPRKPIEDQKRLTTVPIQQRASNDVEYIVEDLRPNEFDVIEPIQC